MALFSNVKPFKRRDGARDVLIPLKKIKKNNCTHRLGGVFWRWKTLLKLQLQFKKKRKGKAKPVHLGGGGDRELLDRGLN